MSLVTAQKRQTLRLPTVDATVDSIDGLAFLGIWQVETSAPALSDNLRRWVLRLPIVDAAVDELDAWGFLHIPQSGGAGNVTIDFSLSWNIDPTIEFVSSQYSGDGAIGITLGGFSPSFNASQNIVMFARRAYSVRFNPEIYR